MPLDDLPIKKGEWSYSDYFVKIAVVKAWGRLPSEFDLCPPEHDLAVMYTFESTRSKMDAFEPPHKKKR